MNLPQVPTDNLYKYLNVGGLTLFIFSVTAYFYTSNKLHENWSSYSSQIEKTKYNYYLNITQKVSYQRKLEILQEMVMKKYKLNHYPFKPEETSSLVNFDAFYLDFQRLEDLIIKIEEIDKAINLDEQKLKDKGRESDETGNLSGFYLLSSFLLSCLGFILFVVGGVLWYRMSQRYLDKEVILKTTNDKVLQLKLDSAMVFNTLVIELYPSKYWEELDYSDYLNDIAFEFKRYEEKLGEYQKKFALVLDTKIIKEIKAAATLCSEGKFQKTPDGFTSNEGLKTAELLMNKMETINNLIKQKVSIYTT